jgi:dTDP-4-dehydrorhamnose reductase
VIFFSTDCVFSGKRGRYSEADTPDPIDLYGRSKLLGEVQEAPHLTIRCSIIGRELSASTGLIEWFLSQRGREIQGFSKAIYSGLTTRALCQLLMDLLEKRCDLSGIWHIASEPISKFDLLGRLVAPLGLGIQIHENVTFECDRSLDSTQFTKETGLRIPSWEEMLADLVEDAKNYEYWRR